MLVSLTLGLDHTLVSTLRLLAAPSSRRARRRRPPSSGRSSYCAEGAAPVEIDHERIERLGVRVRRARLLPDAMGAELRHDPERLALAVREIAAAGRLAR